MEGINKKHEQGGLFGERQEEVTKRPKTYADYTTQQKIGLEERLKRKIGNPKERLDQEELDYMEAKRKAFNGE